MLLLKFSLRDYGAILFEYFSFQSEGELASFKQTIHPVMYCWQLMALCTVEGKDGVGLLVKMDNKELLMKVSIEAQWGRQSRHVGRME